MNFTSLLKKFIEEISKYIENNNILEILLKEIDEIKDKKIEQIEMVFSQCLYMRVFSF